MCVLNAAAGTKPTDHFNRANRYVRADRERTTEAGKFKSYLNQKITVI